jgi:hypothetical protein
VSARQKPRQKRLLKRKKPPPSDRRCTAQTKAGKRCARARMEPHSVCFLHLHGGPEAAGKIGGGAVSARWREILDRCNRLPILSNEGQARYLVALIEEEDSQPKRNIFILSTLLSALSRVTKKAGDGAVPVSIRRVITLPPGANAPPSEI